MCPAFPSSLGLREAYSVSLSVLQPQVLLVCDRITTLPDISSPTLSLMSLPPPLTHLSAVRAAGTQSHEDLSPRTHLHKRSGVRTLVRESFSMNLGELQFNQ